MISNKLNRWKNLKLRVVKAYTFHTTPCVFRARGANRRAKMCMQLLYVHTLTHRVFVYTTYERNTIMQFTTNYHLHIILRGDPV